MYIQFFPTLRCNESCTFCFNRGISGGSDFGLSEGGKLADILAGEGINEIDILGGEPTLHPDLMTLIGIFCEKGLHVSLSTNGFDIESLINLSENFDRSSLSIGLSLNHQFMDERISSYIHEYKPYLKSVCTSEFFLPDISSRFLDITDIRYYAIFMDVLHSFDLRRCLSFPRFYGQLQELKGRYENVDGVYCQCFLPDIEDNPLLAGVRCPAGTTKLSVMPDGSAFPCYLLFQKPEFKLGNIMVDNLNDIIRHPALTFFKSFKKNNCPNHQCGLFSRCHGGCPAVSLMVNGHLDSPDPRCWQL